jgi:hypothetical protein
MTALAPVLQAFFTDRLMAQRRASSRTIVGCRGTFRLLLGFATDKTGKTPSALDIADLDAPLIAAFLDYLEHDRHNTVRTRNWRLAAIHSLSGYAALHHPNTPRPSSECWPSRPNATSADCSPGSPNTRSTPCSPHLTAAHGQAGATTRCSSSPSRPGCGSPSSSGCPAATSSLTPAPTSAAWAKAARNVRPRSLRSPLQCCAAAHRARRRAA